jgi:hypothetical protein
VSLLLGADDVVLYPPSADVDEHGWRLPDLDTPYWSGIGNLQLGPGLSNPQAASGGGRGPYGPARDQLGSLFVPADVVLLEGSTAEVRGRRYVLSQVRLVADPVGGVAGELTCWAATATSVDTWPDGGTPTAYQDTKNAR